MNKKYIVLFFTLLGIGAYLYFSQGNKVSGIAKKEITKNSNVTKVKTKEVKSQSVEKKNTDLKNSSKTIIRKKKQSLNALSDVMGQFTSDEFEMNNLTDRLTDLGLDLTVATDESISTGKMHTIRTKNTIPGTRYFHAQVFYDENDAPFVQHMSFEYEKSESAFAEAVEMAKIRFGLKKAPDYQLEGFASWKTENGYVIWVKKLEASDLKDNPYNAYTKEDIGTVKVAIEIEIH